MRLTRRLTFRPKWIAAFAALVVALGPPSVRADDILGPAFERAREIIRDNRPDPGPAPDRERPDRAPSQQPSILPPPLDAGQRESDRIASNLANLNRQLAGASSRRARTPSSPIDSVPMKDARLLEIQTLIRMPPLPPEILVNPETLRGAQIEVLLRDQRARERHAAILNGQPLRIVVEEAPNVAAYAHPWYAKESAEMVTGEEFFIKEATRGEPIDPDVVRAVMWMESTHGYYDRYWPERIRKSHLPMNIHAKYWAKLGYDAKDPWKNIQAGVRILKELWQRTDNPTVEKVASVYNHLGADKVNGYGKTVAYYHRTKPWTKTSPPRP